jgi:excisionase family DNA binding protein
MQIPNFDTPMLLSSGKIPMDKPLLEILTIEETSEYLRIPISSLYKLAQAGKVPCQKVGRHWRFHRAAIDRWLGHKPDGLDSAREKAITDQAAYS